MSNSMKDEKVKLLYTEKIGRRMLAIRKCPRNPDSHCYDWTFTDAKPRKDGTERITFLRAGCRSLRQVKNSSVAIDTPLPSLVAIRSTDNVIRWSGEGSGANHFCAGPKERVKITALAIRRSMGAELAVGLTETATSAVTRLEVKLLEKLAGEDEENLLKARQAALCENTEALMHFFVDAQASDFLSLST